MAMLQSRPKCRQITNPKFVTFFSSSSSSSSRSKQATGTADEVKTTNKTTQRSSISILVSLFSDAKIRPKHNQRQHERFTFQSFREKFRVHQYEPNSGLETRGSIGSDSVLKSDKEMSQRNEEGSPVAGGLGTETQENRVPGKNTRKVWTLTEDKVLVYTLLEFHREGLYHADNGFKKGALKEMESRLETKMPGCGLKGRPHIDSRMKKLKTQWLAVHDLLTGEDISAFRWDMEKKCITAENDVWDAYVQAHPEAAKLRNTPFPYYDDLCVIWGKDTATGTEIGGEVDDGSLTDDAFDELDEDEVKH